MYKFYLSKPTEKYKKIIDGQCFQFQCENDVMAIMCKLIVMCDRQHSGKLYRIYS